MSTSDTSFAEETWGLLALVTITVESEGRHILDTFVEARTIEMLDVVPLLEW